MQSIVSFSVIPKCMTLNDPDWLFALNSVFTLAEIMRLENNCVKTNKDRHILSAVQVFGRDSSFWQYMYKVCVNIRSGSLERRLQTTVGSRVNARLEHLFLGFENNCVKVNTDRPVL